MLKDLNDLKELLKPDPHRNSPLELLYIHLCVIGFKVALASLFLFAGFFTLENTLSDSFAEFLKLQIVTWTLACAFAICAILSVGSFYGLIHSKAKNENKIY